MVGRNPTLTGQGRPNGVLQLHLADVNLYYPVLRAWIRSIRVYTALGSVCDYGSDLGDSDCCVKLVDEQIPFRSARMALADAVIRSTPTDALGDPDGGTGPLSLPCMFSQVLASRSGGVT